MVKKGLRLAFEGIGGDGVLLGIEALLAEGGKQGVHGGYSVIVLLDIRKPCCLLVKQGL